jgi:phosphoenolpyruvate carboxykinase (ATP)
MDKRHAFFLTFGVRLFLLRVNIFNMSNLFLEPQEVVLRQLAAQMPNALLTKWGNYSIRTRVTARSNQYTYFVTNEHTGHPCLSRVVYEKISKIQDAYITKVDMIEIKGLIGLEEPVRAPISLLVEAAAANIAAMQSQLYFPSQDSHQSLMRVIYTPNLIPDFYDMPTLIAVDFENYTTRIMGTDYFGESKKGGLRMWNKWVYDLGGLALHAGCKTYFDAEENEKAVVIIGLSGTGKTTTTFNSHLGSLPVQDDFCALFPDGSLYASENGCFAKTYGLDADHEPQIFNALKDPEAWLENVAVDTNGDVDYFDGSYTTNGRGTFTLDRINHRLPENLPKVSHIIILNRNFDILPGIVQLKPTQAIDYFMLGETTGTSAGGQAEAGKFLRVPGTNPFFHAADSLQGQRFRSIIETNPEIKIILMNTGCVGGKSEDPCAVKVKIAHSSAMLEALLRDEINWREEPDFGYLIPNDTMPDVPDEIIYPMHFYFSSDRKTEYLETVEKLTSSRRDYLASL